MLGYNSCAAQFLFEQGNGRQLVPPTKIKMKQVGAKHETSNKSHPLSTVDRPSSSEQQPTGERRSQDKYLRQKGASTRHPKLWDIYSKVAVIPIQPSVPMNYACDAKEAVEDEACTIILPRLPGSPNRRRRIVTSSLTGGTVKGELPLDVTQLEEQVIDHGNHPVASPYPSGKENTQVEVAKEGRHDGRSSKYVNLELPRLGLQRKHSNKSQYSAENVITTDLREMESTGKPKSTLVRHRNPVKHRELRFLKTADEYVDANDTCLNEPNGKATAQRADQLSDSFFEKESVL